MNCINKKCKKEIPDESAFCLFCGAEQVISDKKTAKRKSGDGSFSVRKDGTVMYRVTLDDGERKAFYGKTEKECRQKYKEYLDNKGVTIEKVVTVSDWAEKWLEIYKKGKVEYGTYHNYELYVKNHIIPDLGHLKLNNVRPAHIEEFFSHRTHLSESARRHIRIALRGIFETAVDNKYCISNPVKPQKSLKKPEETIKIFTLDQLEKLISDAKAHKFGAYVLIPLYTGMRLGELLALQWGDIDLKHGIITVRQSRAVAEAGGYENKTTKNRKVRAVDIGEKLNEILSGMPMTGLYLFSGELGRPISPVTYNRRYKEVFEETGNFYLSAHKCRHTYASELLHSGVDIRLIQELLGHTRISTTEIYTHVTLKDVKGSSDKLSY